MLAQKRRKVMLLTPSHVKKGRAWRSESALFSTLSPNHGPKSDEYLKKAATADTLSPRHGASVLRNNGLHVSRRDLYLKMLCPLNCTLESLTYNAIHKIHVAYLPTNITSSERESDGLNWPKLRFSIPCSQVYFYLAARGGKY